MKKLYILLAVFCFASCNKIYDSTEGKGEIRYEGRVYPLKYVRQDALLSSGTTFEGEVYYNYYHPLLFTGTKGTGISAVLEITAENIELSSGTLYLSQQKIDTEYNTAQVKMKLEDEFVHFARRPTMTTTATKLDFKFINKGEIFEIELKYADSDSDFLIKWEGPIKDWWTW